MLNSFYLLLTRTLIVLSLNVISFTSITFAMQKPDIDELSASFKTRGVIESIHMDRVKVLENKSPNYSKTVQKVKNHLQTMLARKRDYIQVMEAFISKFADEKIDTVKKLEIIDPIWSQSLEKHHTKSTDKRAQLRDQLHNRWATLVVARNEFKERLTVGKNGLEGYSSLIGICDEYLSTQDPLQLTPLLDSLFCSHLLSLTGTVRRYMPPSGEDNFHFSHLSLKIDEINTYYTQDARLETLSELYYIMDFVCPLHILLKAGLQPSAKDWDFSVSMQKFIAGKVTLDDPALFLLDGFLYQKGIEKANASKHVLGALAKISSNVHFGGVVDGNIIKFETLSSEEKDKAIKEYNNLYDLHRQRVTTYIEAVKRKNQDYIGKSRAFLEATLSEKSGFALVPKISSVDLEPVKTKNAKKKTPKKKAASTQHSQSKDKSSVVTSLTPPHSNKSQNEDSNLSADNQVTDNQVNEPAKDPTNSENTQAIQKPPETAPTTDAGSAPRIEETLSLHSTATPASPLIFSPSTSQEAKNKKPLQYQINKTHLEILLTILDARTSPFTINYTKALNAMSKIGITERPFKRKGDYRKLVRVNAEDACIGKVFAYYPATSTLGFELMKIYRNFINDQLKDRPEYRTILSY